MPRPIRIQYPGAWYHVMNHGSKGENIFLHPRDYETFIGLLQEVHEGWNLKIAGYCLLPSHYHLLVHTPDGNLSSCMRHINGLYTRRFNHRHNKDGQLFRDRYKAVLIEPDSHLLDVLRYIHKIPLRAGLCKELHDYSWSSHHGYISNAKKMAWLQKDILLSMFCVNEQDQKTAYMDFVSWDDSEMIQHFYSLKNLPSVLGCNAFKKTVKEEILPLCRHKVTGKRKLAPTVGNLETHYKT